MNFSIPDSVTCQQFQIKNIYGSCWQETKGSVLDFLPCNESKLKWVFDQTFPRDPLEVLDNLWKV